jgi:excisionase family DNA binding protein
VELFISREFVKEPPLEKPQKITTNKTDRAGFNLARGADYLGTSKPTLSKMLAEGLIPYARFGKRVFISKQVLDKFLEGEAR